MIVAARVPIDPGLIGLLLCPIRSVGCRWRARLDRSLGLRLTAPSTGPWPGDRFALILIDFNESRSELFMIQTLIIGHDSYIQPP